MTDPKHMLSEDQMDKELNAFFDQERARIPVPNPDVMARILADADAAQPNVFGSRAVEAASPWWKVLFAEIGGWPSLAGFSTAALVGLWIGLGTETFSTESFAVFSITADATSLDELDPFSGLDFSFEG